MFFEKIKNHYGCTIPIEKVDEQYKKTLEIFESIEQAVNKIATKEDLDEEYQKAEQIGDIIRKIDPERLSKDGDVNGYKLKIILDTNSVSRLIQLLHPDIHPSDLFYQDIMNLIVQRYLSLRELKLLLKKKLEAN